MIYLIMAFCCSALVSITMRLSEEKVKNNLGMLAVNYIVCIALAWMETGFAPLLPRTEGLGFALSMGAVNGVIYPVGFVLLHHSIRRSGVVLSATFMKLGLLVTMVMSVTIFGEEPGVMQLVGFVLAVAAIVLINYRPGMRLKDLHPELLALLLIGGLGDGMSKVYEEWGNIALSDQFLLYTFVVALVLCFTLAAVRGLLPGKWEWIFGVVVGVPNFYSCQLMLKSLSYVPGVIVYPVYSVAGILLVTLAGVAVFREKLTKRQWTALAIILLSLVLLNV